MKHQRVRSSFDKLRMNGRFLFVVSLSRSWWACPVHGEFVPFMVSLSNHEASAGDIILRQAQDERLISLRGEFVPFVVDLSRSW